MLEALYEMILPWTDESVTRSNDEMRLCCETLLIVCLFGETPDKRKKSHQWPLSWSVLLFLYQPIHAPQSHPVTLPLLHMIYIPTTRIINLVILYLNTNGSDLGNNGSSIIFMRNFKHKRDEKCYLKPWIYSTIAFCWCILYSEKTTLCL